MFDGGYVMVDDFTGASAAYSFGISNDVSWDLDMARRGLPVFQYDHTIEGLPSDHASFHWRKLGLSGARDEANLMESVESALEQNGHLHSDSDLILKCDIEGSEWEMFREAPSRVLSKFRQIVFEMHHIHFFSEWPHCENVRATLCNLLANHQVVHVHGNNFGGWTSLNGVPVQKFWSSPCCGRIEPTLWTPKRPSQRRWTCLATLTRPTCILDALTTVENALSDGEGRCLWDVLSLGSAPTSRRRAVRARAQRLP